MRNRCKYTQFWNRYFYLRFFLVSSSPLRKPPRYVDGCVRIFYLMTYGLIESVPSMFSRFIYELKIPTLQLIYHNESKKIITLSKFINIMHSELNQMETYHIYWLNECQLNSKTTFLKSHFRLDKCNLLLILKSDRL